MASEAFDLETGERLETDLFGDYYDPAMVAASERCYLTGHPVAVLREERLAWVLYPGERLANGRVVALEYVDVAFEEQVLWEAA